MIRFVLAALLAMAIPSFAWGAESDLYCLDGSNPSFKPCSPATPLPVVVVPSSATGAGLTPIVAGSAVSSAVLKASPGVLYSVYAECSVACWLMVFNAIAAPTNGSTTAGTASGNLVECVAISAAGNGSVSYAPGPPAAYSVGITAVISSTTCATLTLATTGFIHGMVQ